MDILEAVECEHGMTLEECPSIQINVNKLISLNNTSKRILNLKILSGEFPFCRKEVCLVRKSFQEILLSFSFSFSNEDKLKIVFKFAKS